MTPGNVLATYCCWQVISAKLTNDIWKNNTSKYKILHKKWFQKAHAAGNAQQQVSYFENKDKRKLAQQGQIPGGRAAMELDYWSYSNKRLATTACFLVDPLCPPPPICTRHWGDGPSDSETPQSRGSESLRCQFTVRRLILHRAGVMLML